MGRQLANAASLPQDDTELTFRPPPGAANSFAIVHGGVLGLLAHEVASDAQRSLPGPPNYAYRAPGALMEPPSSRSGASLWLGQQRWSFVVVRPGGGRPGAGQWPAGSRAAARTSHLTCLAAPCACTRSGIRDPQGTTLRGRRQWRRRKASVWALNPSTFS